MKTARCHPVTASRVNRGERIRTSDLLNPIQDGTQPNTLSQQQDTSPQKSACSNACSSKPETGNGTGLEALAAALLGLAPEDRAKLAALLLGQQAGVADNG
jgi:hypothetical protein